MPPNPRFGFREEGGQRLVPGRSPRVRHFVLARSTPTQGDKNGKRTDFKAVLRWAWGSLGMSPDHEIDTSLRDLLEVSNAVHQGMVIYGLGIIWSRARSPVVT
jgi:hypothetical protein